MVGAATNEVNFGGWDTAPAQRLVLPDVRWQAYEQIGEVLAERRNLRLTYYRGLLEFASCSPMHERYKAVVALMVQVLAEESGVVLAGFGSTTLKHPEMECGLEPDNCYYTKNWLTIRRKRRLDLSIDLAPDLVLEIAVAPLRIDRLQVFAKVGVPEVWRFEPRTVQVFVRTVAGEYEASDHSPTFADVPMGALSRFLALSEELDDVALMKCFRTWV